MKTPEDIKMGLECCVNGYKCGKCCLYNQGKITKCTSKLSRDALAYIQRLEAKVPKWISVKEGLPEAHDDGSVDAVLVTDGSFTHMAYCNRGTWHFCECGEMKEPMFYKVTHWMPLPELPKEEVRE